MKSSLPIAETFHSIQGEATWIGTPMHFIRLAGCPVGAKATQEAAKALTEEEYATIPILANGHRGSWCKTYDGRRFACDTDFSVHTHMAVDELIGETWERHICLTGGEPLIHQKNLIEQYFFSECISRGITIHIETSGTVLLDDRIFTNPLIWITCAPKEGYLKEMIQRANEIKLLVDEHFDLEKVPKEVFNGKQVFVSAINDELKVDNKNTKLALDILRKQPNWRFTPQLHKYLGLR